MQEQLKTKKESVFLYEKAFEKIKTNCFKKLEFAQELDLEQDVAALLHKFEDLDNEVTSMDENDAASTLSNKIILSFK